MQPAQGLSCEQRAQNQHPLRGAIPHHACLPCRLSLCVLAVQSRASHHFATGCLRRTWQYRRRRSSLCRCPWPSLSQPRPFPVRTDRESRRDRSQPYGLPVHSPACVIDHQLCVQGRLSPRNVPASPRDRWDTAARNTGSTEERRAPGHLNGPSLDRPHAAHKPCSGEPPYLPQVPIPQPSGPANSNRPPRQAQGASPDVAPLLEGTENYKTTYPLPS